jgi:electron transfer flavoprotein alpha subunit
MILNRDAGAGATISGASIFNLAQYGIVGDIFQ